MTLHILLYVAVVVVEELCILGSDSSKGSILYTARLVEPAPSVRAARGGRRTAGGECVSDSRQIGNLREVRSHAVAMHVAVLFFFFFCFFWRNA